MNADAVRRVLDETAHAEGVEIVEASIDTRNPRIRATIDRDDDPVNVDDCSRVTRAFRRALDAAGYDVDAAHVEVMSPGVYRRLVRDKDFTRFAGEAVRVTLAQKRDGRRHLDGTLVGRTDAAVVIRDEADGERSVPRDAITEVRLDPFRD